jgi:hypothetical protein
MCIKEKIEKEDGQMVHCYKQGAFWVAYEQSAYIICQDKAYKPTKKRIKNINKEVVTIGFPQKALELWQEKAKLMGIIEEEKYKVFEANKVFSAIDYKLWKENITLQEQGNTKTTESLEQKIKQFSLATSTPIEAFLFLQKLQKELL